jgi:hypothetical protein
VKLKYQVWDSEESAETAIEVEAETPTQAAFFAANIRKPQTGVVFAVELGDDVVLVIVEPQTTYQVRVVNAADDDPAVA